ncbi:hypothetical protein YC2023_100745 [Brassica napus]
MTMILKVINEDDDNGLTMIQNLLAPRERKTEGDLICCKSFGSRERRIKGRSSISREKERGGNIHYHPPALDGYAWSSLLRLKTIVLIPKAVNQIPTTGQAVLSAGSVIHAMHEQDMGGGGGGGLASFFPLTYAIMLIGSLPLIGFYSKDELSRPLPKYHSHFMR